MYRECKEELGVDLNLECVELVLSIKRKNVFIDIYLDRESFDINEFKLQEEEVDKVKWYSRDEVKKLIQNGETASSIKKYFYLLCNLIDEESI